MFEFSSGDLYYWGALGFFFMIQLLVQKRLAKISSTTLRLSIGLAVIVGCGLLVLKFTKQKKTIYSEFDIQRGSSYAEVGRKYKSWTRTLHPDAKKAPGEEGQTFDSVTKLREQLSDSRKRLFYDKFGFDLQNNELDQTIMSNIYRAGLQLKITEYLNTFFFWIFILFSVSKIQKSIFGVETLLRLLMAKSILIVYYIFAQDVQKPSLLDLVFPHLPIHQQIYASELIMACIIAFAWPLLADMEKVRTEKMRVLVESLSLKASNLPKDAQEKLKKAIINYVEAAKP